MMSHGTVWLMFNPLININLKPLSDQSNGKYEQFHENWANIIAIEDHAMGSKKKGENIGPWMDGDCFENCCFQGQEWRDIRLFFYRLITTNDYHYSFCYNFLIWHSFLSYLHESGKPDHCYPMVLESFVKQWYITSGSVSISMWLHSWPTSARNDWNNW